MAELTDALIMASRAGRRAEASVVGADRDEQAALARPTGLADAPALQSIADDTVPWFTAAVGELTTRSELERLDESAGWAVLHSVPGVARGSDIDHVVIGPAGVFTISTKHHADERVSGGRTEVFVSGQSHHYVKTAVFAAERASELLTTAAGFGVIAQPVLAFVRTKEIAGERDVGGVRIVDAAELVRWLQTQPTMWGADASSAVARAARRAGFWSR